MPDTEDPQPPKEKPEEGPPKQPTELTDEEYAIVADEYMELVHEKAELIQETREDVEVEYSVSAPSIDIIYTQLIIYSPGRRAVNNVPTRRYLHHQQAAPEQANLAFVATVRTEAIRLGAGG